MQEESLSAPYMAVNPMSVNPRIAPLMAVRLFNNEQAVSLKNTDQMSAQSSAPDRQFRPVRMMF
jgi:hypothetical protein